MDELKEWIKAIQGDVKSLLINQSAMKEDLRHHIMRTDRLENIIEPLARRASHWDGVLKFIGIVALIVSLAGGIVVLVKLP